ncbi:putative carboxylesterase 7 [Grifola frondosa]|uniref:Putative carboxylesterase 7 n=1 Tax=Grifola frondosa TaxID=5627 RepID=A0A1C7M8I9_GRIFR|nr:putative carboxylesterase 7 [Grifola frondosa]
MDSIAANKEVIIPLILQPTKAAFLPLLEEHRLEIESFRRNTFKYGHTDRHQLDVYYPPAERITGSKRAPVLFFAYGGGFTGGTRSLPPPEDIVYNNLATFFANRGFIVVIPDYRLVPEAKFPEPAEDVRDAISWVVRNTEEVMQGTNLEADTENLFVMGHSAGANHVMTMLLYPGLLPHDLLARIRGVIPRVYYGSEKDILDRMPITLLRQASDEAIQGLPDLLLMASENDPGALRAGIDEFVAELKRRLGRDVKLSLMVGHNHISPHWALWSGAGEEWAVEVTEWIKEKIRET